VVEGMIVVACMDGSVYAFGEGSRWHSASYGEFIGMIILLRAKKGLTTK
jgi:hypothetical protein